jgi:ribonuclease HI
MVYIMEFYVDGGCRRNGQPDAIGAAAIVLKPKFGKLNMWSQHLPSSPTPTNQRAEITAIIMALNQALQKLDGLDKNPYIDVRIYSDSRYAVDCMTKWIYKWTKNDWTNAQGFQVANRDLLEQASRLDDRVAEEGEVHYYWIPRDENQDADECCNEALDELEY